MKRITIFSKIFIYTFFLTLQCAVAQFNNIGTSAANFLKIAVGSRGAALGGAFVATVDDPSALYWNPAGIARLERNELMFAHNDWIADLNHSFFAGGFPVEHFGTIGISISYLSMDEMKITTWEQPEGTGGTFTAYDFAFGLAYANNLTDQFRIGIQTKFISEVISESKANAFAADVGLQFNTGISGIKLGAAVTNFGTNMRLEGRDARLTIDPYPTVGSNPNDVVAHLETQEWSLPLTFHFGIAFDAYRDDISLFQVNLDYRDERDFNPIPYLGIEWSYRSIFFLRGGSNIFERRFEKDFTLNAGAGIHWELPETGIIAKIDYAYSDLNYLLAAHRITVGCAF
jgi:long-subunit fatty acid transport protein